MNECDVCNRGEILYDAESVRLCRHHYHEAIARERREIVRFLERLDAEDRTEGPADVARMIAHGLHHV
jgi:hypothetical protein